MIKKNIKKIISAILIGALALCLFGCGGEKGEQKLSTVEELSSFTDEIINNFSDYTLTKSKDNFLNVYYIQHNRETNEDMVMDILNGKCNISTTIIYGIPNDDNIVYCEMWISGMMNNKIGAGRPDGIYISDGENIIKIDGVHSSINLSDKINYTDPETIIALQSTVVNDNEDKKDEVDATLRKIAASENDLKLKLEFYENSIIFETREYEFTKDSSDEFKKMVEMYFAIKDKCDQDKVKFLL